MTESVFAVVVTHRRPDELAKSLDVLTAQTPPGPLIVVDNDSCGDSGRGLSQDNRSPPRWVTPKPGRCRRFRAGHATRAGTGRRWVWLADDDGHARKMLNF